MKVSWHHAGDGTRQSVDADAPAEHRWICPEPALPEIVPDDDLSATAAVRLVRGKGAAIYWRDRKERKGARRDDLALDWLRLTAVAQCQRGHPREARELGEQCGLCRGLKQLEPRERPALARESALGRQPGHVEDGEAIGFAKWRVSEQRRIDERRNDGARRRRQGDRRDHPDAERRSEQPRRCTHDHEMPDSFRTLELHLQAVEISPRPEERRSTDLTDLAD